MSKQLKADMMLLTVTFGWGISYYLMDESLSDMGELTLNMYRSLGAFAVAAVISFPKLKTVNKTTLKWSFVIGWLLVLVYVGATFGVKYTTITNAGFCVG